MTAKAGAYRNILRGKFKVNKAAQMATISGYPSTIRGSYRRIFTYAVLENLNTGKQFLHLNTHLDTAGNAIRETKSK